jgi:cell fate (sporulation/competence/biofilm development) regulator YlbF (YheA/YmcA/DUF963 family)
MEKQSWNELEVAPRSAIMEAAKQFAGVFAETTEFLAFEQAFFNYRKDEQAQRALKAFQQKQAELKPLIALNAVSEDDREELQRLQDDFNSLPSVMQYYQAQIDLVALSQEIGDRLSTAIGLDYASACRTSSCCG